MIAILGELIGSHFWGRTAQDIVGHRNTTNSVKFDGTSLYSLQRIVGFGMYGLPLSGPVSHWWSQLMDYLWNTRGITAHMQTTEARHTFKIAMHKLLHILPLTLATVTALRFLSSCPEISVLGDLLTKGFRV